ncbi:MAG: beta-glucosidase [Chloroflexales bacterium]|nr:beta-glucosidase [Chloroflexales bacterium]
MEPLFRSLWLGGFESACHINRSGARLDMLASTQHDLRAAEDYRLLRTQGIAAARDGVRWPLIDRGGRYDFASLAPQVQAAAEAGVDVIWTLCHYGWPDDIDLFSPAFVSRFARFCAATARFIKEHGRGVPAYSPINEISFFAWAAGDVGYIYPFGEGQGLKLKKQLVRAAIAGSEAILAVEPRARLVHIDPIIHVVPPHNRPDLMRAAARQRAGQFESWDMLAGRQNPELGGSERFLDIVGVNFYHANQWEHPGDDASARLRWEDTPRDLRWLPLHQLLAEVHARYRRPLLLSETSHFGVGRAPWISEIAHEVLLAWQHGVPLGGICLYPILDRHDWDDPNHWHNSGLWELEPDGRGNLVRVLDQPYAAALHQAQQLLAAPPLWVHERGGIELAIN